MASSIECMGSEGHSWQSLAVQPEMRAGYCAPSIEFSARLFAQRYLLVGAPTDYDGKTVCHWRWQPDSRLLPEPGSPVSIVCTFTH